MIGAHGKAIIWPWEVPAIHRASGQYPTLPTREPGIFDELEKGDPIVVEVQQWLAEKSGLA